MAKDISRVQEDPSPRDFLSRVHGTLSDPAALLVRLAKAFTYKRTLFF